MGGTDFYAILGVSAQSEDVVITAAYKALMMKYHPDRNRGDAAAEARAKRINEAYDVLRDPGRRAAYDASRRGHAGAWGASPPPPPPPSPPSPPKPPPPPPPSPKPSPPRRPTGFEGWLSRWGDRYEAYVKNVALPRVMRLPVWLRYLIIGLYLLVMLLFMALVLVAGLGALYVMFFIMTAVLNSIGLS